MMSNNELFLLYNKVQNKDKEAEDRLILEHGKQFGFDHYMQNSKRGKTEDYRTDLHTMYLHLTGH